MTLLSWQYSNLIAFCGNTLITYSVGSTDYFGKTFGAKSNKQISEQYPTLVTPSGYAFAIWGPIFLLEGASVLWQCFRDDKSLEDASKFWCLGCLFQAGWTIAFAFEKIGISSVVICGLAGTIGCAYASTTALKDAGTIAYVLGSLPFAMHTGWLVAAALVNININAVHMGASPSFQLNLAWVSEFLAGVCSAALAVYYKDPTFAFVGAWALTAISRFDAPESLAKQFQPQARASLRSFATYAAGALCVLGAGLVARSLLG
jgi:benzodiazapine receptor